MRPQRGKEFPPIYGRTVDLLKFPEIVLILGVSHHVHDNIGKGASVHLLELFSGVRRGRACLPLMPRGGSLLLFRRCGGLLLLGRTHRLGCRLSLLLLPLQRIRIGVLVVGPHQVNGLLLGLSSEVGEARTKVGLTPFPGPVIELGSRLGGDQRLLAELPFGLLMIPRYTPSWSWCIS